jgi:hypothetical protein
MCGAQYLGCADISRQDVRDYFINYFQCNRITDVTANGGITVKRMNKHGVFSNKYVPYWTGVRIFLEKFFVHTQCPGETVEGFARRVMRDGVCTEIVPFGAKSGKNMLSPNLVDYCWQHFSGRVLEYSSAPLIVLVGAAPRDEFVKKMNPEATDLEIQKIIITLKHGDIWECEIGGKKRKCVALAHFSRWGIADSGILLKDFSHTATTML